MNSLLGKCVAPVGWGIAGLIGMFVGQSMAAEPSLRLHPGRAMERTQPATAPPKVVWPDNGIAQRRLEGGFNYDMFVENDNGTWRAWVQSDMSNGTPKNREKAVALDFFSGKKQRVKASLNDESKLQEPGFMDSKGNVHGPHDQSFEFNRGGSVAGLKVGVLSLDAEHCSGSYFSYQGGVVQDWVFHPTWTVFPLIHDMTNGGKGRACRNGSYNSNINSTLDLNDGTFLVTIECWIFRLRKADLSPAGEAPALRLVDGKAMKAAIDQAKWQRIEDANVYLAQALDLHFDEAQACGR